VTWILGLELAGNANSTRAESLVGVGQACRVGLAKVDDIPVIRGLKMANRDQAENSVTSRGAQDGKTRNDARVI
jgi:hypothetical protein